jgi:hypothetical protein
MSQVRVWYAVDVSLRNSPPMATFRQVHGPTADAFFYRAYEFCKLYARAGAVRTMWPALANFVGWHKSADELRDAWRACGLVFGTEDELFQWMGVNGWILAKQDADRKRSEKNRRAARIGQRKRRAARAAAKRTTNGRLVGR